jgi:uncharacterized protein YpmB
MSKVTQFIIGLIAILIIGGGVFLIFWDIPAPAEEVTKTISNDRFPQ